MTNNYQYLGLLCDDLIYLLKCISKKNSSELVTERGREGEKYRSVFLHWFTLQMLVTARAGPGLCQEPRTPHLDLPRCQGAKYLDITCCIPRCTGQKLRGKQRDWESNRHSDMDRNFKWRLHVMYHNAPTL